MPQSERPLDPLRVASGAAIRWAWQQAMRLGTIGPNSRHGRRFGHLGEGSAICFPTSALFGERWISIGDHCMIGPYSSLSAGVSPEHVPDRDPVIEIGDRTVIGKGSGIVGHREIVIGDDVWTGHHVYVTDANHGYEDVTVPIGKQFSEPRPVSIGSDSWLGHGAVALPGATIGRHVVIGAGAVVTGEIPDFCVAVGNPARVIRRYVLGEGWVPVNDEPPVLPSQPAGLG